jgi:hypothetical protein
MENMGFFGWIGQNWFALLQTGGVIGALAFTGCTLLLDARNRRVGNLIQLTQEHRRLWERITGRPELVRILDPDTDLSRTPLTADEEMFVIFLILHLNCTWYAIKSGFYPRPEGLRKDVRLLFSRPIPRTVWEKVKELQDRKFVAFVESCFSAPETA